MVKRAKFDVSTTGSFGGVATELQTDRIAFYTGWPQSHAPMLIKKVIVVTFIQIQSSLQGLQMLDMFAVCSYARANTKFKVPVDTIQ